MHFALLGAVCAAVLIALVIPISTQGSAPALSNKLAPLTLEAPVAAHLRGADAQVVSFTPGRSVPSMALPARTTPVTFTLNESGFTSSRQTTQKTVGAALLEVGIVLNDADLVRPGRDSELTPGRRVYITYAKRVELLFGAEQLDVFTQAETVEDALRGAGHVLLAQDQVFPGRTAAIRQGMVIGLTQVRDVQVQEDETISHKTVYRYDPNLSEGREVLLQGGADGYIRREYNVTQVNGKDSTRRLVAETKLSPTDAVVAIGTYVPTAVIASAPDPYCPVRKTVWATYYTAVSAGGNGITRTGTGVYKGIIATDPNFIPLGTRMYVPGYGYGIAADTGGGVKGWHVDLGYGADDVYDWGSKNVEICIF